MKARQYSRPGAPASRRRIRPAAPLSRLPRHGYIIREKHLRRYRALTRELAEVRSSSVTFAGLLNMGEEGNEIWVEAGLPEPEKRFTVVHELVHARRQRAGQEIDDEVLEEAVVEFETVSRVHPRTLHAMPSGAVLVVLHRYLTGEERFNPESRAGLRAVYRRIKRLLGSGPSRVARPFQRPWGS